MRTTRRLWRLRWLSWLYALTCNYFWLPCPVCGGRFGGHEMGYHSYRGWAACPRRDCQRVASHAYGLDEPWLDTRHDA